VNGPLAAPLRARLRAQLGERSRALALAVSAARAEGERVYLVGGPVRDLLLGRAPRDLDLLLSARARQVAERCARALGGAPLLHAAFLTARVEASGLRIDFAQARVERYPRPGALPQVRPASVAEDLARRDFAIHAIALPLHREAGARLLDPHGGVADLAARRLRILHEASFVDDPTRLFRAARYAARLGFRLERGTRAAARDALASGALDTLSASRLAREIDLLLAERGRAAAARGAERLGLWRAVQPGLVLHRQAAAGLARLERLAARPPFPEAALGEAQLAAAWRLLLTRAPRRVRGATLDRLGRSGRPRAELEHDVERLPALARSLARTSSPGRIDAVLGQETAEALVFLACSLDGAAAARLRRWARDWRLRPSPLDGHAARALGLEGPAVGAMLREARARDLDGKPLDVAWQRGWLARARRIG
jgi:tRNA nucleotidyltransferase (CCA-adding enzyme)